MGSLLLDFAIMHLPNRDKRTTAEEIVMSLAKFYANRVG